MDGIKKVEARLVAKGFQDPDLTEGLVDTSGCVSLRSSHLQVASLSALNKWKIWSLDIKMRSCKQMDLIVLFFRRLRTNGIRGRSAEYGN